MLKSMKTLVSLATFLYAGFLSGEQTLSILKPDAVENHHIGEILTVFENNGLHIAALKMVKLTPKQAGEFYADLKERPFYPDLVKFMSSGPVVISVLEGDNAIKKNRDLMGATDPKKAAKGTIRAKFSTSIGKNTVHGSDSEEAAKREIAFFFTPQELVNKQGAK